MAEEISQEASKAVRIGGRRMERKTYKEKSNECKKTFVKAWIRIYQGDTDRREAENAYNDFCLAACNAIINS